ncbi:MAG TPA: cation diffusion facilitator family transporter [Thermoanaerobaculia bacterium]|nr:cation diffusion facilitator family transporter [Thermoanaerobaculia bacterium]
MRVREVFRVPEEQAARLRRARRLEWATLFFMTTIVTVVGLAMGSSQAMKAAWVEDLLSLVPPAAFLVAARWHDREPDPRFPYGYQRAFSISFLIAAAALFGFGLFILYDSAMALVKMERPTIGTRELFGEPVWSGWLMIAALAYSAIPPVVLGRLKLSIARELHNKTLHTDADMNKADWMTAVAGILGILGIGIGWWWADAVAAGVISLSIVKDGFTGLRHSVADLMDRRPATVERGKPDPVIEALRLTLEELPWVRRAEVRLREEGMLLDGEAFVVAESETVAPQRLREAEEALGRTHWRVHDIVVTPVSELRRDREARQPPPPG